MKFWTWSVCAAIAVVGIAVWAISTSNADQDITTASTQFKRQPYSVIQALFEQQQTRGQYYKVAGSKEYLQVLSDEHKRRLSYHFNGVVAMVPIGLHQNDYYVGFKLIPNDADFNDITSPELQQILATPFITKWSNQGQLISLFPAQAMAKEDLKKLMFVASSLQFYQHNQKDADWIQQERNEVGEFEVAYRKTADGAQKRWLSAINGMAQSTNKGLQIELAEAQFSFGDDGQLATMTGQNRFSFNSNVNSPSLMQSDIYFEQSPQLLVDFPQAWLNQSVSELLQQYADNSAAQIPASYSRFVKNKKRQKYQGKKFTDVFAEYLNNPVLKADAGQSSLFMSLLTSYLTANPNEAADVLTILKMADVEQWMIGSAVSVLGALSTPQSQEVLATIIATADLGHYSQLHAFVSSANIVNPEASLILAIEKSIDDQLFEGVESESSKELVSTALLSYGGIAAQLGENDALRSNFHDRLLAIADETDDPELKSAAIMGLGNTRSLELVDKLTEYSKASDFDTQRAAIIALGQYPSEFVFNALKKVVLNGHNSYLINLALEELKKYDDEQVQVFIKNVGGQEAG